MNRSLLAALQVAPFQRLFTAQVFSNFGDWLSFLAITTLLTYSWQQGPGALTGFTVATCLPYVLFGSVAGAFAGRVDKRKLMVTADLARFLLSVCYVFAPNLYVLLTLVVLRNVFSILFNAAKQSVLRQTVPEELLLQANALSQLSTTFSKIAGPALGAVLLQMMSPHTLFVLDACTFAISAGVIWQLRAPAEAHTKESRTAYRSELRQGLRFVLTSPKLLAVLSFYVAECFVMYLFETPNSLIARAVGFDDSTYGYLVSAVGLGSAIGALLVGKWASRLNKFQLLWVAAIKWGLLLLLLGLGAQGILPVTLSGWLLLWMLIGVDIGAFGVCYGFLLQIATPPAYMSLVAGTADAVTYGAILTGSIASALFIRWIGIGSTYILAGVLMMLVGIVYQILVRRLHLQSIPNLPAEEVVPL